MDDSSEIELDLLRWNLGGLREGVWKVEISTGDWESAGNVAHSLVDRWGSLSQNSLLDLILKDVSNFVLEEVLEKVNDRSDEAAWELNSELADFEVNGVDFGENLLIRGDFNLDSNADFNLIFEKKKMNLGWITFFFSYMELIYFFFLNFTFYCFFVCF